MLTDRPPTQQDVARRAGVSAATVSYILNGRRNRKKPVSDQTRERVLRAVEELGYQRNHAARSLRRRRTELIAMVHRPPSSPWGARLADQLHAAAVQRGYSVITMPVGPGDWTDTAVRSLREQHVDGAILTPPHYFAGAELTRLARAGLALVVFDDNAEPDGFDVVRQGQSAACQQAVEHLIEQGHRRIAYYGHGSADGSVERDTKYEGYWRALAVHGIPVDDALIFAAAESRTNAYRTTTELLRRPDPPSALFSASDRGALAAIWAAQRSGTSVPDDLAVVGVGNTDEGEVVSPSLTTVGSPAFDFTEVVERLFERTAASRSLPPTVLHQTWELVRRESS